MRQYAQMGTFRKSKIWSLDGSGSWFYTMELYVAMSVVQIIGQ